MTTDTASRSALTYADVLECLDDSDTAPSLLLGNGFSIGASPRYRYQALRERADEDLPTVAKRLFTKLATNNFEQVMQILEDARWVADRYAEAAGRDTSELSEPLRDDIEATRRAMVTAIAEDHLPSPSELGRVAPESAEDEATSGDGERKIDYAARFLEPYGRLFTTNYDLLLYWTAVALRDDDGRYKHPDGLVRPDGEDYGEFDPEIPTTMFFLHGALHLYRHGCDEDDVSAQATARKHVARPNVRLKTLIDKMLAEGRLPLFIAEGTADQKRLRIERNAYLHRCLDALRAIEGDLVVYGHSLGPSDAHLVDAIAENPSLRRLYVGLYGDPEKAANLQIRTALARLRGRRSEDGLPLEIHLFASETAPVWGPVG